MSTDSLAGSSGNEIRAAKTRQRAQEHSKKVVEFAVTATRKVPSSRGATCAECAGRFLGPDLIEVTEDHESLTWFVGDLVCRDCAGHHGVI